MMMVAVAAVSLCCVLLYGGYMLFLMNKICMEMMYVASLYSRMYIYETIYGIIIMLVYMLMIYIYSMSCC